VVVSGDTVSTIAERFGMRSADLRALNNLTNDNIRAGQKLQVSQATSERPSGATTQPRATTQPAPAAQSTSASASDSVYVVVSGDTVSTIAERFGMRSADLRALNNLTNDNIRAGQKLQVSQATSERPSGATTRPGATAQPASATQSTSASDSVYVVVAGDSISTIAERFGMKSQELRDLNNLTGNNIRIGQKLKVSAAGRSAGSQNSQGSQSSQGAASYTVSSGDSLFSIARKHNLTVDQLKALNGKTNDSLRAGEVLKVK
jgi:LysM repeat protein